MSVNSRFAVAVHVLALLALEKRALTSKYISFSVNTNPVVIRRILSSLNHAGLVASQLGAEGGTHLAKPAAHITMLDVYLAVEPDRLFNLHHSPPNEMCPCGANVQPVLQQMFANAENAMKQTLAETTLADLANEIAARITAASGG